MGQGTLSTHYSKSLDALLLLTALKKTITIIQILTIELPGRSSRIPKLCKFSLFASLQKVLPLQILSGSASATYGTNLCSV